MGRSITVLVRSDGADGKNAAIEINTGTQRWEKFESGGASHVFRTKKGVYRFVGAGGAGDLELLAASPSRAGMLDSFNPLSVGSGAKGQGLSDEVGRSLVWTVDKIIDV